jgi:hypothetical protein
MEKVQKYPAVLSIHTIDKPFTSFHPSFEI